MGKDPAGAGSFAAVKGHEMPGGMSCHASSRFCGMFPIRGFCKPACLWYYQGEKERLWELRTKAILVRSSLPEIRHDI